MQILGWDREREIQENTYSLPYFHWCNLCHYTHSVCVCSPFMSAAEGGGCGWSYGCSLLRLAVYALLDTQSQERDTKRESLSAREREAETEGKALVILRARIRGGRAGREGESETDRRGGRHGAASLIPDHSPPQRELCQRVSFLSCFGTQWTGAIGGPDATFYRAEPADGPEAQTLDLGRTSRSLRGWVCVCVRLRGRGGSLVWTPLRAVGSGNGWRDRKTGCGNCTAALLFQNRLGYWLIQQLWDENAAVLWGSCSVTLRHRAVADLKELPQSHENTLSQG